MSRSTNIINVPDFRDINGRWVTTYHVQHTQHHTRAGKLWTSINTRCKVGGCYQKKFPTYVGTTNGFGDFQDFVEWCHGEYGYLNKEDNGRFWSLDKDYISCGNKVYCEDKCLFVPNRVNSLLLGCDSSRGDHPLGVCWHKQSSKYLAYCCGNGKQKYLGSFTTPLLAHQMWQKYKISVMENVLRTDDGVKGHLKLVQIIEQHIQRIKDDLDNNQETV